MDLPKLNEYDIEEPVSLEFEDEFGVIPDTPSFDVIEDDDFVDADDSFDTNSEDFSSEPSSFTEIPENVSVETEFFIDKKGKNKQVRVKYQDVSKPYQAKVTSLKTYTNFLKLVDEEKSQTDMSPDSGINELAGLTVEEQEKQKQEWADALVKLEEEIETLRTVLQSKIEQASELKRKLGVSVWKEFQDDMSQGLRSVKNSNVYQRVEEKVGQFSKAVVEAPLYHRVEETVEQFGKAVTDAPLYHRMEETVEQLGKAVTDVPLYQKTESVIKATTEKTSTLLGGLGSGISCKIGQLKNSDSFRSFEEKVGSAYENVKTKVSTSRSSSMQSFDDVLRESDARNVKSPTTPTIEEERLS